MKDNAMKKIMLILTAVAVLSGCSYDELPPKTDDITTYYVLPKGTMPSPDEEKVVKDAQKEYKDAIKK